MLETIEKFRSNEMERGRNAPQANLFAGEGFLARVDEYHSLTGIAERDKDESERAGQGPEERVRNKDGFKVVILRRRV